MRQTMNDKIKN